MYNSIKFLSYSILLISIYSVIQWSALFNTILNNTFFWWLLQALILYNFYILKNKSTKRIQILKVFLIYVIISFLYGIYMSNNYWHYKNLIRNFMVYLMPLCVYAFINPQHLYIVLKIWFKKAWIVLLCLSPFLYSDAWGNFLTPFCLLALFFFQLPTKWKIATIIAFIITFTLDWASRSCTIRFSIAFLICLLFSWGVSKVLIMKYRKIIFTILSFTPIIFFTLAVNGVFNIFQIDKELGLSEQYTIFQSDKENNSMLDDTRTLVYAEVLNDAQKNNYIIQGHSLARGYYSPIFNEFINKNSDGLLKGERAACEVCILNIFTYMGIIGVIFYMLIFIKSTYMAMFKSNNDYVKAIAIFVLFRWIYSWVEELSSFNITYLTIWIMIAICFSPYFRKMSNLEFKKWFYSILK